SESDPVQRLLPHRCHQSLPTQLGPAQPRWPPRARAPGIPWMWACCPSSDVGTGNAGPRGNIPGTIVGAPTTTVLGRWMATRPCGIAAVMLAGGDADEGDSFGS